MSMIQMNGIELQTYIEKIMQDNPVFDMEPLPVHTESFCCARKNIQQHNNDDDRPEIADDDSTDSPSLYNDLCLQISSLKVDKELTLAAKLIAGNLDERGYLPHEDYASIASAIGNDRAAKALALVQSLTPTGVGARDLSECLCLQLRHSSENTGLSEEIAKKHLELLSKGHFQQIAKLCNSSVSEVRKAAEQIRNLNPKPSAAYAGREKIEYVVPDLFLESDGTVTLNGLRIPKLTLSAYYQRMLENATDAAVTEYLREKFKQANMLVNNLQRRNKTILLCMNAVISMQKAFFITGGNAALLPMTQIQIAQCTGLSESTVSRAINGKFIQCSFGTYPLTSFFSSSLGEDQSASSADAKERIRKLIANEDKASPLSDKELADILSANGVPVSRRTVAKYRQQMSLPGTYARKRAQSDG